ncbi:hypothetical protein [Bartonella sp. HY761]|uniref:hypothetical protein n=1 Tax=Bartonella sp. HY761 TaxID=2979330 RepID=UPI002201A7CA|nr:hypothetical protein [Bartonella sp. HY761]UXN05811.1 hypothetical protein N6A79_11005 [Bartonella sp. HY761]
MNDNIIIQKLRKPVDDLRQELSQFDGDLWKKSSLSLHYDFSEIVIHILMQKDEDLEQCYQKVRELYLNKDPILYSFEIDAYFLAKANDNCYHQFSFMSFTNFLAGETLDGPLDPNNYDVRLIDYISSMF